MLARDKREAEELAWDKLDVEGELVFEHSFSCAGPAASGAHQVVRLDGKYFGILDDMGWCGPFATLQQVLDAGTFLMVNLGCEVEITSTEMSSEAIVAQADVYGEDGCMLLVNGEEWVLAGDVLRRRKGGDLP
jgi:hypothetical protein